MKKKGYCFKRAVSLLLAAVMIITAAPQMSLTVLAAEQGMSMDDPDVSEDFEDLTTEDDVSMETDDTVPSMPEDGAEQDGTEADDDSGDKSADVSSDDDAEVGGDEQTADPAADPNNDSAADEETVSGNDTADGDSISINNLADGDSISVNALSQELNYLGEILEEKIEDGEYAGTSYLRLCIEEGAAAEKNSSRDISPILEYYKEKKQTFNCVEFSMIDESPNTRVVKKDYINGALSIMDTGNTTIGCWIDYNFWNDQTDTGVVFSLSSPYDAGKDVSAAFTLTDLKDQGLKVKFASTAFPAEQVSMSYDLPGRKYADSFPLKGEFRLFTHSSGTPKAMVSEDMEQCWGYYDTSENEDGVRTNVYFNNIRPLGATEYLAASIYEDEESPVIGGEPVELKAGKRAGVSASSATSVTWKVFDTENATIDKDGKLTAWSDWGDIYYYVRYKVGSAQYLEVHKMQAKSQPVKMYFDEDDITLEMSNDSEDPITKYLRLRFKPSGAERDPHNPKEIKWEITEGDCIGLVYYDNEDREVNKDDEGAAPNGEIIALKGGEATVTASYLDDTKVITTATCHVKVVELFTEEYMEQKVNEMNLYAVTDLDTKLSDVALDKGWKWVYPDTSLTNFKGSNEGQFPAVYTEGDKTFSTSLCVRFVNVTSVEIISKNEDKQEGEEDEPDWFDWVPDSIEKGDKVTLGYFYNMDNLGGESKEARQKEYDDIKKRLEENYRIEWTSSPVNAGTAAGDGATYQFTAPASITKAQKYTFTVSLKDKKNKVYLKNSSAITVTVKPSFDWEKVREPWVDQGEDGVRMYLRCIIWSTKEEYEKQPLTIVSEDPAILKLKGKMLIDEETNEETGVKHTCLSIECEKPKPGTAWIKVTASDEMKSVKRYCIEFIDKEPKLNVSAVTINQALEDRSAAVTVRTHMQYPLDTSQVTLQLNGKDTTDITPSVIGITTVGSDENKENSYCDYNIKLALKENAGNVKKGKNTATLKLVVKPVDGADTKAVSETYSLNLTVNIINTVPKVTFKQAKKVNIFYNDKEGYGVLNVNATGAVIKELVLNDCGYELKQEPGDEVYYIVQKEKGDVSSKKGKLSYKIEGCSGTFETAFTVSTENKKPTIVLSQKSDTLYPVQGYKTSCLKMSDKATGDDIVPSAVTYVDKKNKVNQPLTIERNEVDWKNHTGEWNITGKTDYNLLATTEGDIIFLLQDKSEYKTKTDKFSLEIKETNWTEAVTISYSIKADTAKPKLVLGKSTLTLNKNVDVYRAQQERTSLHLKGTADPVYEDDEQWVRFEGQDEKSRKILRADNSLVLKYEKNPGDVIVRFNDNKMDPGNYKFNVSVGNWNGLLASTVLTVKIVDIPKAKTLKVTAKGSIDVMNRERTMIAYTPKISNISGNVVEGRLEGMDSDLFEYEWDDGKLIVKAKGDITYNTKHTYRVRAVFEVETEDYDHLTVYTDAAKPLTIKVKQSKPKLTASTAGNTIYRQLDNTVEIKLSAMLNKREVDIDNVWLINYTEDFELKETPVSWTDEEGEEQQYDAIYNPETKSVRLGLKDRYEAYNTTKSGKTYKVKLAVRYCEQAGNEKETQVTCSIVVR